MRPSRLRSAWVGWSPKNGLLVALWLPSGWLRYIFVSLPLEAMKSGLPSPFSSRIFLMVSTSFATRSTTVPSKANHAVKRSLLFSVPRYSIFPSPFTS
ncbi:unknown [Paraprevotella clara CAG:116]|nr:unknown [Paraprevotella clara CAG:116]